MKVLFVLEEELVLLMELVVVLMDGLVQVVKLPIVVL